MRDWGARAFEVVRRWWWIIALGAVLGAGAGYVYTRFIPTYYVATTTLALGAAVDAPTSNYVWQTTTSGQTRLQRVGMSFDAETLRVADKLLPTYARLLGSDPVSAAILVDLQLNQRYLTLPATVFAQPVPGTLLLEIRVRSRNAQLSKRVADAVPAAFNRTYAGLLAGQTAGAQFMLQQEVDQVTQQIARMQAAIAALVAARDRSQTNRLNELRAELNLLNQSRLNLLKRHAEFDQSEAAAANSLLVLEPPIVPATSTRPSTPLIMAQFGLLGMLVAIGLVGVIGRWDDRVRTAAQIERATHLAVIGSIAQWPTSTAALIALHEPQAAVTEAFRALRTSLRFASVAAPLRTVLITSDEPGEGKSTVAANLAVVMAQDGLKVALVDADLRRPTLHTKFDCANRLGLTEALMSDPAEWPAIALNSPVPNVTLITSGQLPPNPAELLGSQKMRQWLDYLRQTHDVILLDAPPVLPVTDAAILARLADGVIWVAAYGQTRPGALAHSKQQIDRTGVRQVGMVLNRLPAHRLAHFTNA